MRRAAVFLFVVAAVLAIVPGWSGETRLPLLDPHHPQLTATRVSLDPVDPRRVRVGRLLFLGGIALRSRDAGFGGFSSLAVAGERVTLLSDGGNAVSFRLGPDWRPHAIAFANLPGGPGTGWQKLDRDSESMVVDPVAKHAWIGFESANAIWRYDAGLARVERHRAPLSMRAWPANGGAEAMTRMSDGRFVVISELANVPRRGWRGTEKGRQRTREGLIFASDPTDPAAAPPRRFAYLPADGFDVSDATALPDGDLIVVERRFRPPYRFSNRITLVRRDEVRPAALAHPELLARLDAPLIHDNFEGVAVTREGGATVLWLCSDDNQSVLQRSLLLKFRLDPR